MFQNVIQTLRGAPNGDQGLVSPETIRRRRALAARLLEQGGDFSPVASPWQGIARVASGLRGAIEDHYANEDEMKGQKAGKVAFGGLASALGIGDAPQPATPQLMNINPVAQPASATPASASIGAGGIRSPGRGGAFAELFKAQEEENELPAGYLARTAQIESSTNPNAKNPNSSAGGMFQFIDGTAKDYGLANRFDPNQATKAAAELAYDNKQHLMKTLGREPSAAELYLAHQQGADGAAKMLANPNARAVDIVGADAIRLNGGNANMTTGEFAGKWLNKFGGAQPVASPNEPTPQTAPASGAQSAGFKQAFTLMNSPAFQYLQPGQQQMVQSIVQRGLSQETADPMKQALTAEQLKAARFANAEAERKAGATEMEYFDDAATGQRMQRIKGSNSPAMPVPGLGAKTVEPALKEFNGRMYRVLPGGKLEDATPEGFSPQSKLAQDIQERTAQADKSGLAGEDRQLYILNGKIPNPNEKLTQDQANSGLYADRMKEGMKILERPEISAAGMDIKQKAMAISPFGTGNMLVSKEFQQFDQAKRDFINATLRRESGAAIGKDEFANADKQYFMQPGDSTEVVAQKRANMKTALDGIARAGGQSYYKKHLDENKAVASQPKPSSPQPAQMPSGTSSGNKAMSDPLGIR